MKRAQTQGAAYIEFAFAVLVLVPLLLGLISIGINLHLKLLTVQVARDSGHMFARGIDFTLTGNKQVLAAIGTNIGLSATAGSGNALVILSTVRYVDVGACNQAGKVDSQGNPSGCTNYQKWVFAERVLIGNNNLATSHLGTPPAAIIGSDGTDAGISVLNQVTNTNDVASITGFIPYSGDNGGQGLPANQLVYVAETVSNGFQMPPFSTGTKPYSVNYF